MTDERGDNLGPYDALAIARSERAANARGVRLSEELAHQYATQAHLTMDEAAAILQGHAPLLPGTVPGVSYLVDFEGPVKRLINDAEHGRLPMPCKPIEFDDWAHAQGLELPPEFSSNVPRPVPTPGVPPINPSPVQQDRQECQEAALKIWGEKPSLTIEKMLTQRGINSYARKYTDGTVRRWLSKIDPRAPDRKPGRRRNCR